MKRSSVSMVTALIILGVALPMSHAALSAAPGDFAGGDGSAGSPYQISNWHHLNNVRNHLSDHFIVINDLLPGTDGYTVVAGPSANGTEGWQPIGSATSPFDGSFKGQGYQLRGLYIDRSAEDEVGLFGYIGSSGVVETVRLALADVEGRVRVGSLAGRNHGTVYGCDTHGSVSGRRAIGGLVGASYGTVTSCFSVATVYGEGDENGDSEAGGLVGVIGIRGTVTRCYATGSVQGDTEVGGLVGHNYNTMSNCYATGSVEGQENVGGLLGHNRGVVDYCYSNGSVNGPILIGGLVGYSTGEENSCFWDTDTSGMITSYGDETGKTTAEMLQFGTFADWDITGSNHGFTYPSHTWNIVDRGSYPYLSSYLQTFRLKAGWNMVSIPGALPADKRTVEEVFKGEIVAIYTWNPETKSYTMPTEIFPYVGYWVAVTEDKTIAYMV